MGVLFGFCGTAKLDLCPFAHRVGEWITRGRSGVKNRALRTDIVLLSITPEFLPCKHPSAAWVASQHGVSRQRASELWREFADYIGPYIQFRGQHFRNRHMDSTKG
jgi:hypothetical protein